MRPSAMVGGHHTLASKGNVTRQINLTTPSSWTKGGTRNSSRPSCQLITVKRAPTTAKPQHSLTARYHSTKIQHQGGGYLTSPSVYPNQPTCPNNSLACPNPQLGSMPEDFIYRHTRRDTMNKQRLSAYRLRPRPPDGGPGPPLDPFLVSVGTNVPCVATEV